MKLGLYGVIFAAVFVFAPGEKLAAQARAGLPEQVELPEIELDDTEIPLLEVDPLSWVPGEVEQEKFDACMQGCERGPCKIAEHTNSSTAQFLCVACYNSCSVQTPLSIIQEL
ncbi:MAG: hypothetical protein J0M12_16055 [Deltaproteobacteria bacterium]|nr:hypothetical protein [Deltaproteobacteria bacterium]